MAETVSGTITSNCKFLNQSTLPFGNTYNGTPSLNYSKAFTSATITKLYFQNYTITTTPTVIDVTALTNSFGTALNFATIKHIQIVNHDAAKTLTVGGGTTPIFSTLPVLVGGGCISLTTTLTMSGSVKLLSIVASANSVSADILFCGT